MYHIPVDAVVGVCGRVDIWITDERRDLYISDARDPAVQVVGHGE